MPHFRQAENVKTQERDGVLLFFVAGGLETFGTNEVGQVIWQCLATPSRVDGILETLEKTFDSLPEDSLRQVEEFLEALLERGLAERLENPPSHS